MKVKIFIACHKPCEIRHDDVYTPIHVGFVNSKFKKEMKWMQNDATGENISEKNPYYCEMTAQYWVWKNIHDIDYVGFCHYRRFQSKYFTNDNIISLMDNHDVIFNEPIFTILPRLVGLKNYLVIEDIYVMFRVVKKLYPDYYNDLLAYSNGHYSYIGNMLVCKKKVFDDYAKWIFSILSECEQYVRLGSYSRQRRIFGYIAEFLMPVYFMHKQMRIKTMPFIYGNNQIYSLRLINKLKNWGLNFLFKSKLYKEPFFDSSIVLGLKNDGIII